MNNQKVIVRDFQGEPLVRKVWKATSKKVYIYADGSNRSPIGFPREDVFVYEPKLLAELEKHYKRNPSLWNRLMVWNGDKNGNSKAQAD